MKQRGGRLIRTAQDRGVLALLDLSYRDQPWGETVEEVLPEGAEVTSALERVARFLPVTTGSGGRASRTPSHVFRSIIEHG